MPKMKRKDRRGAPVSASGEAGCSVPSVAPTAVQAENTRKVRLLTFALAVIVVWGLGTYAYIYFMPRLLYNALKQAMVQRGIGATPHGTPSSGIAVNTLFAMSALASPASLKSNFLAGTNHDTLYTTGWLDLSKGPEVLHMPDMAGRYYGIEFVDPWGAVFAYVGRRTTGTRAGDYLMSGPGWRGRCRAETITTWAAHPGAHSATLHDRWFQNLHLAQLQLDDLRTRLRSRAHRLWLWVVLDPISKLIPLLQLMLPLPAEPIAAV